MPRYSETHRTPTLRPGMMVEVQRSNGQWTPAFITGIGADKVAVRWDEFEGGRSVVRAKAVRYDQVRPASKDRIRAFLYPAE